MRTSPLLTAMHEAVGSALDDIRSRITNVRFGLMRDGKNRISFTFDGEKRTAILRGRNQDLVLTGDPCGDASVALRCILDGDMEIEMDRTHEVRQLGARHAARVERGEAVLQNPNSAKRLIESVFGGCTLEDEKAFWAGVGEIFPDLEAMV